jgi:hypothetical protein
MAVSQEEKVRENRLRRMADRQGLKLLRSRRRDPRALDYGLYWLTDVRTGAPVTPEGGVGMDAIEAHLTGEGLPPPQTSS